MTELAVSIAVGSAAPLGATLNEHGINFALFSAHADAVDLCLFDADGHETCFELPGRSGDVFHGHVGGLLAGQPYGYRVHGPYDPPAGHHFNPAKLLVDPYAKLLAGEIDGQGPIFGFAPGGGADPRDSAAAMPKGVVVAPLPHRSHARPCRPWAETVIYEAHLGGLTRLRDDIPEVERGTFEALAHPSVVEHLVRLGVTAVELMPVHAFSRDYFLQARGLTNYWGYSTLAFLAPHAPYIGPRGREGIRDAIATLHAAGIEVLLDVVFNHTAELDEVGPTLSLRGIDNASYYRLDPADPARYVNESGCGNTLACSRPAVAALILDALRYWTTEYGVDGFRFDLATVLGRDPDAFSGHARLLAAIASDPVLADLKMIAEPWDIGPDGYRLGEFPRPFAEWNDTFRDAVRSFWRGDHGSLPGFARAITGSREVFEASVRGPQASVNFVACHDGFTLDDLVSYAGKHNEANGEANRDGSDHNLSENYGVEGPTGDPAVRATRARQARNLLTTVFLSQGVPMLGMGDELSRSQGGNNNAYCQDNATSWLDWNAGEAHDPTRLAFTAALAALRARYPALRRTRYFEGRVEHETGERDVSWLAPEAREMRDADWAEPERLVFGMEFGGDAADDVRLLLLVNASRQDVVFRLAPDVAARQWVLILDTAGAGPNSPLGGPGKKGLGEAGTFALASRSQVLFQRKH